MSRVMSPKPRFRGRSHQLACGVAAAAGTLLYARTPTGRAGWGVLVYSIALVALFGISATYHRIHWSTTRARQLMRRLDHSAIYVLIAGTYTPLCLLALPPQVGSQALWLVWGGAAFGILKTLLWPRAPKWLSTFIYALLGASMVPHLFHHGDRLAASTRQLLLLGGGAYLLGSLSYALRRPDPLPAVFGYHEIFHLWVVVAASCHFAAIYGLVS